MKVLFRLTLLFAITYLFAVNAQAEEIWTDVTEVKPILEERRVAPKDPACAKPKPSDALGLAALLTWDVGTDCSFRTVTATRAYRVHYQWAGHQYSFVTKELPEQRIKLEVEVRPD